MSAGNANTGLYELILDHIKQMDGEDVKTEEYERAARSLKVLMEARKIENEIEFPEDAGSRKLDAEARKAEAESEKILAEIRKIEIENEKPWYQPSADQVVAASATIFGIVAILSFEKVNVVTSKALSFVPKIRI